MGDTSPKNQDKLVEQKNVDHEKKIHDKQENAEQQHHHQAKVRTEDEIALLEKDKPEEE